MALNPNFVFTYTQTDAEIQDLFLAAMQREGLIFEDKDLPIRMDGKTRYVKVANRSARNRNNRSGWYNGRLGDFPGGKFGWMHGENPEFSWSLYRHVKENGGVQFAVLSEEEVLERQKRREQEERNRKREEMRRFQFSKALTIIEWARSLPLVPHPYTTSKNFSIEECSPYVRIYNRNPYNAKELEQILAEHFPEYNKPSNIRKLLNYQAEHITYRGFNLIMKGELIDGTPLMFQLIFNKKNKNGKNKHFPRDLIKQNTFLRVGKPLDENTSEVIICEGWATGMSLLRYTQGQATILIAWDSGNMQAVAKEIRHKYKHCKIYSASDNDHTKPDEKNAGLNGALKLCHAVGAYIVMPAFDSSDPAQNELSDWNDIDNLYPPPVSSAQFFNAMQNARYVSARFDQSTQLLTEHNPFHFRSVPDVPHDEAFTLFWNSLHYLVSRGIQHCDQTTDEQKVLLDEQIQITAQWLSEHDPGNLKPHYDPKIELSIQRLMFEFCNEIFISNKNPMLLGKLFKQAFSKIRALQPILPHISLLELLLKTLSEKLDPEIALGCLLYHLQEDHYFARTQKEWLNAVASQIRKQVPQPHLIALLPSLLCSKEIEYWKISHKIDRECAAADQAIARYHDLINGLDQFDLAKQQQQHQKLKYLYQAYHEALLNPDKQDYLQRLIQRYQATENSPEKINLFFEVI